MWISIMEFPCKRKQKKPERRIRRSKAEKGSRQFVHGGWDSRQFGPMCAGWRVMGERCQRDLGVRLLLRIIPFMISSSMNARMYTRSCSAMRTNLKPMPGSLKGVWPKVRQ